MNRKEASIQYLLFFWLRWQRRHRWICPHVRSIFTTGECDLFSLTDAGSGYEWEIKTSRADFKADAKKGLKEHGGKLGLFEQRLGGAVMFNRRSGIGYRHEVERPLVTPHFFSYVVPTDLVSVDEVPTWAGLYYINTDGHQPYYGDISEVKKPERIHSDPLPDNLQYKLGEKLMHRFWVERNRLLNELSAKENRKRLAEKQLAESTEN